MAISNYGDLKRNVQLWLNRNDNATVSAIPTFISFAEQDFQRTIKIPEYEMLQQSTVPNADLTIENGLVLRGESDQSPYYETKHMFVNDIPYARVDMDTFRRWIRSQESEAIAKSEHNVLEESTNVKNPEHLFCRFGSNILFSPPLVNGDVVKHIYWEKYPIMESLGDNGSPETLKTAPDVLLYLALHHAAVFLRDNDQAQYWTQKAEEAGTRLMMRIEENEWSGSPITVRDGGLI